MTSAPTHCFHHLSDHLCGCVGGCSLTKYDGVPTTLFVYNAKTCKVREVFAASFPLPSVCFPPSSLQPNSPPVTCALCPVPCTDRIDRLNLSDHNHRQLEVGRARRIGL